MQEENSPSEKCQRINLRHLVAVRCIVNGPQTRAGRHGWPLLPGRGLTDGSASGESWPPYLVY